MLSSCVQPGTALAALQAPTQAGRQGRHLVAQALGTGPLRLLLLTDRKESADMDPFVPHAEGSVPARPRMSV